MRSAISTVQFSFASMLVGTAMLAFVVYATVYPSVWAATLAFSAAVGVLSLAVVRGLATSGASRRYWLSFGLVGLAYLAMLYAPVLDERVGSVLATTIGFAGLEGLLYDESRDRSDDPMQRTMSQRYTAKSSTMYPWPQHRKPRDDTRSNLLPQETWAAFAFHSTIAVICGLVAGWVASWGSTSCTTGSGRQTPGNVLE